MNTHNSNDNKAEKGKEPGLQDKPDDQRVKTVTPDNDNGDPGPQVEGPSHSQKTEDEHERQ